MPQSGQDQSQSTEASGWWRIEWLISSGLGAAIVAGAIWVGTIDERVQTIKNTVNGLDNSTLGSRITALEVKVGDFGTQQDRVERKIDRLLDHQYGNGAPVRRTGDQQ